MSRVQILPGRPKDAHSKLSVNCESDLVQIQKQRLVLLSRRGSVWLAAWFGARNPKGARGFESYRRDQEHVGTPVASAKAINR